MTTYNQNAVSKVAWPWTQTTPSDTVSAPEGVVKKALLQASITVLIGLAVRFFFHKPILAVVIWGMAGVMLVLGLTWPAGFRGLEKALALFGKWVGSALTFALLTPFFYLCFVPARLIMRAAGKDPLNLSYESSRASYWDERAPVTQPEDHFKAQY